MRERAWTDRVNGAAHLRRRNPSFCARVIVRPQPRRGPSTCSRGPRTSACSGSGWTGSTARTRRVRTYYPPAHRRRSLRSSQWIRMRSRHAYAVPFTHIHATGPAGAAAGHSGLHRRGRDGAYTPRVSLLPLPRLASHPRTYGHLPHAQEGDYLEWLHRRNNLSRFHLRRLRAAALDAAEAKEMEEEVGCCACCGSFWTSLVNQCDDSHPHKWTGEPAHGSGDGVRGVRGGE